MQLHSQRVELFQANQLSYHSQREKSWLCTELDRKERFLQEDRMKSLHEIEELKKLCCTEAERAKQVTIVELSVQEKQSQSTVNQLMVQIQELQDKVNSLSDSRELNDPETAGSSGLSPRSQSAYEYSESPWMDWPRFLPAA